MSFSRPIQWYHSHADPIWPDGNFNDDVTLLVLLLNFLDGDLECSDVLVLTRLMMRESLVYCLLSLLADQPTNQTIFTIEQRYTDKKENKSFLIYKKKFRGIGCEVIYD
jgi:hypothetical protein